MNPTQETNITKSEHTEIRESTDVFQMAEILIKENPNFASGVILLLIFGLLTNMALEWGSEKIKILVANVADQNTKNWGRIEAFNTAVEKAMGEVYADMAFVVRCHNGGGIPQPGCQTFSTITNRFGEGSTDDIWTSFPHDSVMASLVTQLLKEHVVIVETDKLEKSDLKRTYDADKVTYSISCLLTSTRKEIFYSTFNFTEPFDKETAEAKADSLRIRSRAIANMLGSPKFDIPIVSGILSLLGN